MAVLATPIPEDVEVGVKQFDRRLRIQQAVLFLTAVAATTFLVGQLSTTKDNAPYISLAAASVLLTGTAFVVQRRSVHRVAFTLSFVLSASALVHAIAALAQEVFDKGESPSVTKETFYISSLVIIFLVSGSAPWGPSLVVPQPPQSGIFGMSLLDEEEEGEGEEEALLNDPQVITDRNVMRVRQSSWLSFIFMSWPSDLILLANKKVQLASSDIPMLPRNLRGMTATLAPNSLFYQISAARKPFAADGTPQQPLTAKCLLWLCAKSHWKWLAIDFLVRLFTIIVAFVPPLVLHALIGSFETVIGDGEKKDSSGNLQTRTFLLCAALCASQILSSILDTHNHFISEVYVLSLIRAQLAAVLFDKALTQQERVSTKLNHTSSKILNLLNSDSQALPDALRHFRNIVLPLFRLGIGSIFIYKILGWSGLVAMLFACILFPASSALGRWSYLCNRRLSHARDKRVSLVQETVAAIKTIKLNAWENKAFERITALRDVEVKAQRERYWIGTCWNVAWDGVPVLIQLAAFMLYTKVQGEILTPSTAFVALNVFNICSSALTDIPASINDIFTGIVSLQRIVVFLNGGDLVSNRPIPQDQSHAAAITEAAEITWPACGAPERAFKLDLGDLVFRKNEISLICGNLGSGKTLLLRALLGEAEVIRGTIYADMTPDDALQLPEDTTSIEDEAWLTHGSAYVPQSAYIRHASIRDNILFGLPFNAKRYLECLTCCALLPDLDLLEDHDMTEVGERGVTLSGGQHVSLARAVYSRSRTLMVDDVLSAVDAHTSSHLITKCFKGRLMQGRTLIMATHSVASCLPIANHVIEIADGTVNFNGPATQYSIVEVPQSPLSPKVPERSSTLMEPAKERPIDDMSVARLQKPARKLVEAEHRAIGRVEWEAYRFMLGNAGGLPYWLPFLVIFVGTQVLTLAEAAWVREWTSVIGTSNDSSLGYYLGIYALLIWLGIFADAGRWVWLYQGFCSVGARVNHLKALQALLGLPLRFFDTTPQGRILARFGNDISRLDGYYPDDVGRTVLYGLQIFTPAAIILKIAPAFGIIVLCSIPLFAIFYSYYVKGSRDIRRIEIVASAPVMSFFAECTTVPGAAAVIRSFGACRLIMISMMRVRDIERVNSYSSWASQLWAYLWTNIANAIITSATGVLLVWQRDRINAAQAGFTLLLGNSISGAVLSTLQRLVQLELTMISGQRIYEYASMPAEALRAGRDVPAGWPYTGDVELRDLHAGYAPGLPDVLRGVDLRISSGERVGVVGATGGGKSSLVSTIFRLIDIRSGSILIDGIDISTVQLSDLRSRLTIVPQDPVLISGSLRSTLDYLGEHEDTVILQALKSVHLLSENGSQSGDSDGFSDAEAAPSSVFADLDTVVASGGTNFSLGQRQLLVLAQSMLKQSKILVLDEATASIDYRTDALISETIRNEFYGTTLLVVAHRLRTIIDFDKIIVMDAGRVAEFDSPARLLADRSSRFYTLCKATGASEFADLQRLAKK